MTTDEGFCSRDQIGEAVQRFCDSMGRTRTPVAVDVAYAHYLHYRKLDFYWLLNMVIDLCPCTHSSVRKAIEPNASSPSPTGTLRVDANDVEDQ